MIESPVQPKTLVENPPGRGLILPTNSKPVFMSVQDYFFTWVKTFSESRDFAAIHAMNIQSGHAVDAWVHAMQPASLKGNAYASWDRISTLVENNATLARLPWEHNPVVERRNQNREALFKAHPQIQTAILGPDGVFKAMFPSQNPDHRKFTAADKYAGLTMFNFTDTSIWRTIDAGVTFSDPPTVEAIQNMILKAFHNDEPKSDYTIDLTPHSQMLVCMGERFKSNILGRIHRMLEEAQENFTFVSQMTPDALPLPLPFSLPIGLAHKMAKKARKTGTLINIYNSARNGSSAKSMRGELMGWGYNSFREIVDPVEEITVIHHKSHYLHAKIFMKDIKRDPATGKVISGEVLITSDNGVFWGKALAAKEVGYWSDDPDFVDQVVRFIDDFENQPRSIPSREDLKKAA